jgi:hypothetical protein
LVINDNAMRRFLAGHKGRLTGKDKRAALARTMVFRAG